MPIIEGVTTKAANQTWQSPDGQRKLYEVGLDHGGKLFKAKTYSGQIATVGWSGDVETEERAGKFGPETFVKQPQKAGGFGSGGFRGGGAKQADPFAMYLSYAKDLAVAFIALEGDLDAKKYTKALEAVVEGGKALFDTRPGAEQAMSGQGQQSKLGDSVTEIFGDDTVVEEVSSEPLKLDDLPDLG